MLLLGSGGVAGGGGLLIAGLGVGGGVVEGIVLGGGRKAAAHRYGAHIGIEDCGCDGR